MAEEANPKPAQTDNSNEAPKMPQIKIMPTPEAIKVDMSKKPDSEPEKAASPSMPVVAKLEVAKPAADKADASSPSIPKSAEAGEKTPDAKKDEDNVFTQLFGDDKVMQSSNMMDTVKKREDKDKKSIFKKKPSLKAIKEKMNEKSKSNSQSGSVMLKAAVLLLVLTGGFFYSQNSAEFTLFGTNPAQKALAADAEIMSVQAEIYVQEHLSTVLLLDQFSGMADSYLYNLTQSESDINSSNKQEEFALAAAENEIEVSNLLSTIQSKVTADISLDEKVEVNTLISELITALEARSGEVDAGDLNQDIEDLQTTRSLIQSDDFRSQLLNTDLLALNEETIESLLANYTELNKSTQAIIAGIRSNRIDWSNYFDEIETLTKKVDPLFNTEFPGSLELSDIRFSADNITISGATITDDTKNFTLVSNYIDTLESSSSFHNVEDRSYNKNAGEDDYTGNFRISLELE